MMQTTKGSPKANRQAKTRKPKSSKTTGNTATGRKKKATHPQNPKWHNNPTQDKEHTETKYNK